jgi:hypothetical protein
MWRRTSRGKYAPLFLYLLFLCADPCESKLRSRTGDFVGGEARFSKWGRTPFLASVYVPQGQTDGQYWHRPGHKPVAWIEQSAVLGRIIFLDNAEASVGL